MLGKLFVYKVLRCFLSQESDVKKEASHKMQGFWRRKRGQNLVC